MQYTVLEFYEHEWIIKGVQQYIDEWWEPQWWVSLCIWKWWKDRYLQAMIRKYY